MCFSAYIFSLVLCSHSLDRNLTGMAIADITLLSGFEVVTQDLDMVSGPLFIILSARWEELFRAPHVMTYSEPEVIDS